jgi:hypothetical protein
MVAVIRSDQNLRSSKGIEKDWSLCAKLHEPNKTFIAIEAIINK